MSAHGRVLDRRRFHLLAGRATSASRQAVLAALAGYRNTDGGFGWGIEPDLRVPESQPAGALHALETMAEIGVASGTAELLDWLQSVTLRDGGLPFALPLRSSVACAPFWAETDPEESSLQITAGVAAVAHRVARFDDQVREHPWLARVTAYCFDAIGRIETPPFAYVLSFALQFLDAAADSCPEAGELLPDLGRHVPDNGALPAEGGAVGETVHVLDFAPEPGRPVRSLVTEAAVIADLDRLENAQQPDGGWPVDFNSYSAAAALEWRGRATVAALSVLRAHGRIELGKVEAARLSGPHPSWR